MSRSVAALAGMVAVTSALGGCGPISTEGAGRTVVVEWVIDGDTFVTTDDERIRVLGIDTPEIGRDGADDEPCAREAKQTTSGFLEGGEATIVTDSAAGDTDRYGRTLAYVETDGRDLGRELLEKGLADVYRAEPGITRFSDYVTAEAQAPAPACK
ncbi:MAG: thermonuclease family protein [Brevibacterium aurantiacum]|uniref:thermonuclease family protein n=1 Tax=Brevibacterium aurantiacum TaxID=273384 RepID=UPI003F90F699